MPAMLEVICVLVVSPRLLDPVAFRRSVHMVFSGRLARPSAGLELRNTTTSAELGREQHQANACHSSEQSDEIHVEPWPEFSRCV